MCRVKDDDILDKDRLKEALKTGDLKGFSKSTYKLRLYLFLIVLVIMVLFFIIYSIIN